MDADLYIKLYSDIVSEDLCEEIIEANDTTFKPSTLGPKLMPLNDPIASLVAAEPDLVTTEKARVDVELSGDHTYGRTVVDFLFRNGKEANVDVAISINS